MGQFRILLTFAILTAACGKVERSLDSGPSDHRDDGGVVIIADAAGPDATPVACDGPEDCMNPDDPCLEPGTCEDSVCHFTAKDCSEFDSDCTAGICRDGTCESKVVREAMPCGAGEMDCGAFGACGGFADTCDESGTQTRSCTDSTCQSGECVTGAAYDDSRGCSRDTEGVSCGGTETSCGNCVYSSTCDRDGAPVTCTDTVYTCEAGGCDPDVGGPYTMDICHRDTECSPCTPAGGGQGVCSAGGNCISGQCQ